MDEKDYLKVLLISYGYDRYIDIKEGEDGAGPYYLVKAINKDCAIYNGFGDTVMECIVSFGKYAVMNNLITCNYLIDYPIEDILNDERRLEILRMKDISRKYTELFMEDISKFPELKYDKMPTCKSDCDERMIEWHDKYRIVSEKRDKYASENSKRIFKMACDFVYKNNKKILTEWKEKKGE